MCETRILYWTAKSGLALLLAPPGPKILQFLDPDHSEHSKTHGVYTGSLGVLEHGKQYSEKEFVSADQRHT